MTEEENITWTLTDQAHETSKADYRRVAQLPARKGPLAGCISFELVEGYMADGVGLPMSSSTGLK